MDSQEASEHVGALEMLKCLVDELNHLEREYRGRAKQREADVCVYIMRNLIGPHSQEIVAKLELMKSEVMEKAN